MAQSNEQGGDELFELCKEVYELTGWDSGKYFEPLKPGGRSSNYPPKYTSDYLLEKLPIVTEIRKHTDFYLAAYVNMRHLTADNIEAKSDAPLKALLKLTIALSEAGELK